MSVFLSKFVENQKKLASCDVHFFETYSEKEYFMTCQKCGGVTEYSNVKYYIKGYVAAGKSADDICPGYICPDDQYKS